MAKVLGKGIALQWDQSGSYVTIAQLTNVTFSANRETVDVSTHDTTGLWREKIKGWKEGSISFEGVHDPGITTHANTNGLLEDLEDDAANHMWKIIFPDSGSTEFTVEGILTDFESDTPIDDYITLSGTVEFSAAPTLA